MSFRFISDLECIPVPVRHKFLAAGYNIAFYGRMLLSRI